jgi:hypothetical protein
LEITVTTAVRSTDLSQSMRNFLKEVRGVFDTFASGYEVDLTEKAVVRLPEIKPKFEHANRKRQSAGHHHGAARTCD